MYYIVNQADTYDGAPEFTADNKLKIPGDGALTEETGWWEIVIKPGSAPASRVKLTAQKRAKTDDRRRKNPFGG